MKFIKKIESNLDSTVKYIFKTNDNLVVEFSYINKNDGKDIICLPSQTMCNLGCKFCHTLEYIGKIKNRNLVGGEIINGVDYIIDVEKIKSNNRTLLISFMGCGEPILNVENIVNSMIILRKHANEYNIPYIRFAIATSIPKYKWEEFFKLTYLINKNNLPVKIHLSLHYTIDIIRKEWMPNSLDCFNDNSISQSFVLHLTKFEVLVPSIKDDFVLSENVFKSSIVKLYFFI